MSISLSIALDCQCWFGSFSELNSHDSLNNTRLSKVLAISTTALFTDGLSITSPRGRVGTDVG